MKKIIDYFTKKLENYEGEFTFQYEEENMLIVFMGAITKFDNGNKFLSIDCFDVYVSGILNAFNHKYIIDQIKNNILKTTK